MTTFPTNHHSSTVYITFQIHNECGKPKCHRLTVTEDGLWHWVLDGAITLIVFVFRKSSHDSWWIHGDMNGI